MIDAVIFDMDGLLVDSEPMWFRARVDLLEEHGVSWSEVDQIAMAGVHTDVWVDALHGKLDGALSREAVFEQIVARMEAYYEAGKVVLLPGADEAIEACAGRYRLGLASGSPHRLIEACLRGAGWSEHFETVVSSDEVDEGKPAPDVYLELIERMELEAHDTVVIEDSGAGIEAGLAAGARVIAVPNEHTNPGDDVLERAHVRLESLHELAAALAEWEPPDEARAGASAGGATEQE